MLRNSRRHTFIHIRYMKEYVVTFFEDMPQRMKTRVVGGDKGTNGFGFG